MIDVIRIGRFGIFSKFYAAVRLPDLEVFHLSLLAYLTRSTVLYRPLRAHPLTAGTLNAWTRISLVFFFSSTAVVVVAALGAIKIFELNWNCQQVRQPTTFISRRCKWRVSNETNIRPPLSGKALWIRFLDILAPTLRRKLLTFSAESLKIFLSFFFIELYSWDPSFTFEFGASGPAAKKWPINFGLLLHRRLQRTALAATWGHPDHRSTVWHWTNHSPMTTNYLRAGKVKNVNTLDKEQVHGPTFCFAPAYRSVNCWNEPTHRADDIDSALFDTHSARASPLHPPTPYRYPLINRLIQQ